MRSSTRNNLLAGGFLLVALALGIGVVLVISGLDALAGRRVDYVVGLTLAEGAAGIKPGSSVTLGGQPVGRVTRVDVAAGSPDRPDGIDVRIRIRADVSLHESATVFLEKPLLGSISTINIADRGEGSAVVPPGGRVRGRVAPPGFLAQAGFGPEEVERIGEMIRRASLMVERGDRILADVESREPALLEGVQGVIDDARAMTTGARERSPDWFTGVDETIENVRASSERLETIFDRAQAGVDEAREVVGVVRDTLDTNRPAFDRTMANVEAMSGEARALIPRAESILSRAEEGAASFASAGAQADEFLRLDAPTLSRTLANFRLASDQLKLTAVEVRRNPWRLLYTPSTKELENELLYDSARTYAEAVSDLRAASASLEAFSAGASPARLDRQSIESMTVRLREAFAAYEQAERDFLERLIRESE